MLQHGRYSLYECLYRAFIVYANLREDPANHRFAKTTAFTALDPSEKGAISYYLGLLAAKILSDVCLEIAWLMHLQVHAQQLQPIGLLHAGRPDLVGLDQAGHWNVVEAKGSSRQIRQHVVTRAKVQATNLQFVQNQIPSLNVASVAGFPMHWLHVRFEDPKGRFGDDVLSLNLSADDFIREYYAHVLAILNEVRTTRLRVRGRMVRLARLPLLDLSIGLDVQVEDALKQRKGVFASLRTALEPVRTGRSRMGESYGGAKRKESRAAKVDVNSTIGPDGVGIRLGRQWNPQMMAREPQVRI